jgi:4-amino-4-deoxy-L-arabinose transferase-like glycosyltransferase
MRFPPAGRSPRWALAAIVLLALVPRLLWLGSALPLHPDEAATAADAATAPLSLTYAHERGGWVEGTYVWAAAPFLSARAALGTEVAARLPAALAGVALVLAVYALGAGLGGTGTGLLAALCLALAPWGWHSSRLALRASLVPALATAGLALWASAPRPSARALLGGGLLISLAAATYPPARMVLPPVALAFLLSMRERLSPRELCLGFGPCALVFLGLLPWSLAGAGSERLGAVLVEGSWPQRASSAVHGYVVHYLPRFMFSGASSRGFAPEGVGLFPHWQAPFLVAGLIALCVLRDRTALRLSALVLAFPLAAALTRDVPNALRAILGLPALALLAGWGAHCLWRHLGPRARVAFVGALALAAAAHTVSDVRAYFVEHPQREAAFYYPGCRELAQAATDLPAGEAATCQQPFLNAYLRLYAPDLLVRREGDRWILGEGPVRWRLEQTKGRVKVTRLK